MTTGPDRSQASSGERVIQTYVTGPTGDVTGA